MKKTKREKLLEKANKFLLTDPDKQSPRNRKKWYEGSGRLLAELRRRDLEVPKCLAVSNAFTGGGTPMEPSGNGYSFENVVRVSEKKTLLFEERIHCSLAEAVYLVRPWIRVVRASKKMEEAVRHATLRLLADPIPYDLESCVLTRGASSRFPKDGSIPVSWNYTNPCYFQAKEWDPKKKAPQGHPLGFFLVNESILRAELAWVPKPCGSLVREGKIGDSQPVGFATVEAGIVAVGYKMIQG